MLYSQNLLNVASVQRNLPVARLESSKINNLFFKKKPLLSFFILDHTQLLWVPLVIEHFTLYMAMWPEGRLKLTTFKARLKPHFH